MTAQKVFIDLMRDYGYLDYCDYNKSDNTLIYKPNNGFVSFSSIQDPERFKSTEWNLIFLEEANEFTYNDYTILNLRLSAPETLLPNRMILALNPTDAFTWVKRDLLDKDDNVEEVVSNYKDNPFLQQSYIDRLLAVKDPYYRKVFVDGEWGVLRNLIFDHWSEVDVLPQAEKTIYAIDFGYSDPTACVEIRITEDGAYVKELLYVANMTNKSLISWCKSNLNNDVTIYCDPSEPQRIVEMRQADLPARGATKGQDSVRKSIDTVKSKNLYVYAASTNLIKELRSYKWQEDRNNVPTNKPAEGFDHLVDAMRYGIHTYYTNYTNYELIT